MERAHEGRVSACLVHGGVVYTTSYDGSIKVGAHEACVCVSVVAQECVEQWLVHGGRSAPPATTAAST